MTSLPWFRLYHRIVDDEKIRLLAFEDRWHFIAICCLKADGLLDEPDTALRSRKIAVKMGVQARELDEIKRRLFEVGLVDETMMPVAWEALQYKSDSSTDRVRKHREKSKASADETSRNVTVTPPDTDTDTDIREEEPKGSSKKRGCRLPSDFEPDLQFAAQAGLDQAQARSEADKFRDYWNGVAGAKGIKLDWAGTWRNWVRSAAERMQKPRGSPPGRYANRPDPFKALAERLSHEPDRSRPGHDHHRNDAQGLPILTIDHKRG